MKFPTLALVSAWLLAASPAHADTASQLEAKGQELAKVGRYTDAIDAFKAADRLERRASHACLIGLAYTRRELWGQAELAMEECHRRASSADPLPDWVPAADSLIAQRLGEAKVAAIEIHTTPTEANVSLVVSSFAPDETFAPRTIHLSPGHHTIIARAPGFETASTTIEVKDDVAAQRVTIELQRPGRHPSPPPAAEPGHLPGYLMLAGGGALVAAGGLHLFWYKGLRDDLANASASGDLAAYRRSESQYDVARAVTIGMYGVGGVALIAGVILRAHGHKEVPVVSATPLAGGGLLSVEWNR